MKAAFPLRRLRSASLLPLCATPLTLFLLLPLIALAVRASPLDLLSRLTDRTALQAVNLSLTTATTATSLVVLLGTPLAWLLARREFPGHRLLRALVDLPMVLPPLVAGLGLLLAMGERGLAGPVLRDLGIQVPFTRTAVILAQVFVGAPFFVRAA